MKKNLVALVGGTLAVWLLVVVPARLLWGDSAVWFSATAALMCLVPTAATLLWMGRSLGGSPERQLAAVLGGTATRLGFVIAVGMVLFYAVPEFQYQRFWLWVIFFYLLTLALEMVLLARNAPTGPLIKK